MGIAYLRAVFGRGFVPTEKSFQGVLRMRALLHVLHSPFRAPFARPVRFLCFCFVSLALSVVSAASYAETIPATETTSTPVIGYAAYSTFWMPNLFATSLDACTAVCAAKTEQGGCSDPSASGDGATCRGYMPAYGFNLVIGWYNPIKYCPTGTLVGEVCKTMSCPADQNWTLSGDKCTRPDCPIKPLPELPKDDLCAQSIEAGRGKDVNNACSSKLLPEMQKQAQCLADKIHALGQDYSGPSATVRTAAYQKHLLEVWSKLKEIEQTPLSDEVELACAAVIANANNEMDWHKIESDPSSKGNEAPHVLGKAIDIPKGVVDAMTARVSNTTFVTFTGCIFCIPIAITTIGDVQDYVNSATVNPPACNLKWGGRFKRIDKVHFQLP